MSQLTLGTSALRLVPPQLPEHDETSIFERLPISPAAPFESPRLRLAVYEHRAGGRRNAPVAAARRSRLRPAPVRLTRRGRVVVVLFLALIATAALFVLGLVPSQASTGSGAAAPAGAAGAPSAVSVLVQPGDSLWSIATRVAPHTDPRAEVQRIIDRNHLHGTSVQAGQLLVLP